MEAATFTSMRFAAANSISNYARMNFRSFNTRATAASFVSALPFGLCAAHVSSVYTAKHEITCQGNCSSSEGSRHSAREINFLGPLKSNDNVHNSISFLPARGRVGVANPLLSMR